MTPPPEVAAAFEAFPVAVRPRLLDLRTRIFEIAAALPTVGPLEESLKWGQPAYRPVRPRTGTTIRLGVPRSGGYAIYTHCGSSVMADLRAVAGADLRFDGRRGLLFAAGETPPEAPVAMLIRAALTYHRPGRSEAT
ncbi:MAG: DUF1801 domain-containing protein [Pseudomonadota bacterium]